MSFSALALAQLLFAGTMLAAQGPEPAPARTSPLEIHAFWAEASPDARTEKATLLLTPEEKGTDLEPLELDLEVPGEVRTEMDLAARWRATLESEKLWARPQWLGGEASDSGQAVELSVFPAGYLHAGLQVEDGSDTTEELTLRFRSTESDALKLETWQSCMPTNGQVECQLPSTALDIRLEAEGFIPHYLWQIEIPENARRRVGTLKLERGASVIGWIESPERNFHFEEAEVVASPLGAGTLASKDRSRISQYRAEARVGEQGFFQFRGMAPGRYAVVVDHPAFAPTRVDVTVERDEELELAPIALSPPANLFLRVRYPTDPYLEPWSMHLSRQGLESGRLETVAKEDLDQDGHFELGGLIPGEYQLSLSDSRGSRWHVESFALFPGENVHDVEIQFHRLLGTVVLDEEPLVGAHIEIREHEGNAFFEFRTREEGKFYAFLRAKATWTLKVTHRELGVAAAFPEFSVPPRTKGENYAEKTFEIPDTRFFGRVVEVTGEDVSDPLVLTFSDQTGLLFQRPLGESSFSFRGLQPGGLRLEAGVDGSISSRQASSGQVETHLVEGLENGPIQLVLTDDRILTGLIAAPGGRGVAGARVAALLAREIGSAGRSWMPETTTDVEGVFDLAVPASAQALQITVFPPGFAIAQQRIHLREGNPPLIIPVDAVGGSLTVRYDVSPSETHAVRRNLRQRTSILAPGQIISPFLMAWARTNGVSSPDPAVWTIPMMPPGPVRVCYGARVRAWVNRGAQLPAEVAREACVEGELPPHGELVLTVPEELITRDLEDRSP